MSKPTFSDAELKSKARKVFPAGGFGNPVADVLVVEGEGARVRDANGKEYVDFLIGSGPMLIGHRHPAVTAAVREQLEKGTTFFANSAPGILLAEEIVRAIPCAEQVRYTSTGSEATLYAMRAIRAHRRRSKILKFEGGYHGMSDYALMSLAPKRRGNASEPIADSAGIPEAIREQMLVAPFNDLEAVTALVESHHEELAGIIVEPFQRDQALVVEMGMNHAGEIAKLSRIASPSVGAITNVAPAHLGPLGSIEAIARAKGELYAGTRPEGTIVVNLDDPHCVEQAKCFAGKQLGFGRCAEASVRGTPEPATDGHAVFGLETGYGRTRVRLGAPGLHLIEDALCATAAALASGLCGDAPLDAIRAGLEGFKGMPGRLAVRPAPGGLTVIDDSYNSNPHSVRVALQTLVEMRGDGRCMALLGDMLELGPDEAEIHAEVGRLAAELGVDVLIAVGPLSRNAARAARAAGLEQVDDLEDAPAAAKRARELARPGDTLLVKGSRGMSMERAVTALVETP